MTTSITLRRVAAAAAAAAVAGAAFAAAGATATRKGPPPAPANLKAVLAQVKGLKVKDREAKLYDLAKQEGKLTWYTTLSSTALKQVQAAFQAQYPDVAVEIYRASSEDITARVLAETGAGKSGGDLVEINGATMLILQHKKNVLIPYSASPWRIQVPKKYRFDTWTADHLEEYVVAWNTNLVKDPPSSFQDLADPKWKGKISVEPTDVDWFAALDTYLAGKIGQKKADALIKAIVANAQLINGHTSQANALAAGQTQVVVTEHAQPAEQLQAKKAPIAFGPPFVQPVIERPQGLGLEYNLSHPAAALLFYDWILSPAGQKVMLASGTQPSNPYFKDAAFASRPQTIAMDLRPIVSHWAAWNKKWDAIVASK